MDIMVIIVQLLELFIMMGLGYYLMKKDYINAGFNKTLNFLVIAVTMPCLIISSVTGDNDIPQSIVMQVLLIGVLMYIFLPIVAYLAVKFLRIETSKRGLYMFMMIYSNTGFMGFPIMDALFGSTAVFYAAIINMIFNISVFTYGLYLIGLDSEKEINLGYKDLLSPGILSSIFAMCIYFFHIPLPVVATDVFENIGNMTTPLAMMIIGASLTSIPLKEIVGDLTLYPFILIKQLLIPIIAFPFVVYFISDTLVQNVTLLFLAMPVANISVMFAAEYEGDVKFASKTVFLTTLSSVITIPIIVMIL